jgi:hypothetical protein
VTLVFLILTVPKSTLSLPLNDSGIILTSFLGFGSGKQETKNKEINREYKIFFFIVIICLEVCAVDGIPS